ncbi:DEAD/DEAH box helicase [Sanguibacter gelidistatuariae]|nr:DEAD/DEAH box helicase [Sanguibacter gelidistatuariae]
MVTTGTGSGKTEAFLYPIIDHVLRARREGVTGTKALILYPMNALANDQALRLTQMLTSHSELSGITAALYTGQDGPTRTMVTADGLITDRGIIRDEAPDILLTNYKMLDQLLLRHEDQEIWRQSATSLQYLVLDEFHTYDGAQGTDVAMLLRRLGLALKSHWADDDPHLTAADWARPLGRITPVATSATLGDKGDPTAMVDFAHTVFGEEFGDGAVVTESRLRLDEWEADAVETVAALGLRPLDIAQISAPALNAAAKRLGPDPDGAALAHVVLRHLYEGNLAVFDRALGTVGADVLLLAVQAHPLVHALAASASDAIAVADLVAAVLGTTAQSSPSAASIGNGWEMAIAHVVAMLGHVRAVVGRAALSVDVHLWIRELTRIDRAADSATAFRWSDDGPPVVDTVDVRPSFPAVYCRHCGRSGWGIALAPVGLDLAVDDEKIRRDHAIHEGRFRALLYAPAEADHAYFNDGGPSEGLMWFSVRGRTLLTEVAEDDPDLREGWILPVLTGTGSDSDQSARNDDCPSCGQSDGIRFLGSAIATLLSVSLSTLFGSAVLDRHEKKALVFTDSVQDAAHRAGFVQARSHTLTLRAVLRDAVKDGALTLDSLVDEVIRRAGDDTFARYRIIAPDCADRASFTEFWTTPTLRGVSATIRSRVRRRLLFDAVMEFGLNSRTGRTLELTGTVVAEVEAGHPAKMAGAARAALQGFPMHDNLDGQGTDPDDAILIQWVRGVLDRLRTQGAVDHPWFTQYRAEDGARWPIWGGRPRSEGMPAFPRGRPAPAYPRVGGLVGTSGDLGLDPVTSAKSWYAVWTSKVLPVSPSDGGRLVRHLLDRLAKDGVLVESTSKSGATVYAIPMSGVVLVPTDDYALEGEQHMLACSLCHAVTPGSTTVVDQLDGAPCLSVRCRGHLERAPLMADGFYRTLYSSPDMRRVVAREHTSLLDDATRLVYEDGFRGSYDDPQAPNVLVATPTLEMGIDIGDLSAVFLASLPRTVASYVQRVGRAGRLTGNALNLAYVTGRGDHLPKLGDPLSVINGEVRPPATYLEAEEILRRQFTAHLVDAFARDSGRRHPRKAGGAIGSAEAASFLGDLIAHAEGDAPAHLNRFLGTFATLGDGIEAALRSWVLPVDGPGTSAFAAHLQTASHRWQNTVQTLKHRLDAIETAVPELEKKAQSPASTDEDRRSLRSAQTARRLTLGQLGHLQGEYWIGVLEEYGILPNYTLLDDTVTLDVGLSWTDPDTNTFQSEHAQIQRGSAQALREFAPGATFYARGYEIMIDALDLGMDGEAVRPWVFCPACGYGADVEATGQVQAVVSCPRCGSSSIADTGQLVDVVELTHVSAELRRDEVMISDRAESRVGASFQVFTAADIDPANIGCQWFVESTGMGCTYMKAMTIRWLNGGVPGHGGARVISGQEASVALFRICAGCGQKDTNTGRNHPREHRPWCQFRDSVTESTRSVALSRTLHTQGLVVRLPYSVTIGDPFAVPSLSAALLLGLREQVGGHPDHIQIAQIVDPTYSDGSDNHDALLLHDIVPGGTGYLAELASPRRLRELITLAWQVVHDCECQHEDRLACHRCLLPFVQGGAVKHISRAAAQRHLAALLGLAADAETADQAEWEVTDIPPSSNPESHLEQRFRKVVVERLRTLGAAITEVPGAWGNTVRFVLPDGSRRWTLTPQVNLESSKPDFVLESNDMTIPQVAIFTDGHAFHAVAAHNRLADDADKRRILRDTGRLVLSVSAQDVRAAEESATVPPGWFDESIVARLLPQAVFMTTPSAYAGLAKGPIDSLIDWMTDPSPEGRRVVARAVPMFLRSGADSFTAAQDRTLAEIAADRLQEIAVPEGPRRIAVWRCGALAVAIEPRTSVIDVALVLDDRDEALDVAHGDAWREWLRLGNHLALRDWPTTITTLSQVLAAPAQSQLDMRVDPRLATTPESDTDWTPDWRAAHMSSAPGAERELVAALAGIPGVTAPNIGVEGPEGIPIDIAWPAHKVAVAPVTMPEVDRADLLAAGWRLVSSDPATIIATLFATAGTTAPEHDEEVN